MKDLAIWGKALEKLRGGRSFRSMQTAGIVTIPQYKRMIRSKLGPSVAILDRWLKGMGYTWQDWAEAYERAGEQPALHVAEGAADYGKRKAKKAGCLSAAG